MNMRATDALAGPQEALVLDGFARVAKPIEFNASYDEILGERLTRFLDRHHVEPTTGEINAELALNMFDRELSSKRNAAYMVPPGTAVAWGKTQNNLREFTFLRRLLADLDLPSDLFNVSAYRHVLPHTLASSPSAETLRALFNSFLEERSPISAACAFQLTNYALALLNAIETFNFGTTNPTVLALANDHSPNQVAWSVIARTLGIPTIYIQHAEVTDAFPPLDFDLSILRNDASLATYRRAGRPKGAVHIVSRDKHPFEPQRFSQAIAGKPKVGIYLTAQVEWHGVREVANALQTNKGISQCFLKPHPSQSLDVVATEVPNLVVSKSIPNEPHVAIVANSSVVIELLHNGNAVFQHYGMDAVPDDYYGFSRMGLARKLSTNALRTAFWRSFQADEPWMKVFRRYDPWASSGYAERLAHLKGDLKLLFARSDLKTKDEPQLQDARPPRIPKSEKEQLLRELLNHASSTVVDYLNTPSCTAELPWSKRVPDSDFLSALEAKFADRDADAYDLFAKTRRISSVRSEYVYASKRRDIELTGRATSMQELAAITGYVDACRAAAPADWRRDLELLFLLIRRSKSDRINAHFANKPALPIGKLGTNRRIALARWLRNRPTMQRAIGIEPANLYAGLTRFQSMKLRYLAATPEIYAEGPWNHSHTELRFLELAPEHVAAEVKRIFLPTYSELRDRMAYMDVRWNARERDAFYADVEDRLQQGKPFSLIRLSDREAYMFGEHASFFRLEDVRSCERHWWRMELREADRKALMTNMLDAVRNADVLGIPSIYRLLRETDAKTKTLLTTLQGRGLAEVARNAPSYANECCLFSEEKCNVPLFSDFLVIERLGRCAQRTVLVASAHESKSRQLFRNHAEFLQITIPTHSRTRGNSKYDGASKALPHTYRQIRELIFAQVQPGDLVLIAAGVIGKIFAEDAKKSGGVALDVGTCMDDWMDAGIHSLH